MDDAMQGHRVVIIGSGFGGLFSAEALKKVPVEVTLISNTTTHLFQPLLYQVATGILSQGEISPATRDIVKNHKNTEVLVGDVWDIDVENKIVKHRLGALESQTPYDSLIVAAGAGGSYFGHPEYEDHAPGLKTIDDALEIRSRVFGAFEYAELETDPERRKAWLTFVVVGAGPTGVEMAGQIAELAHRALKNNFRNFNPADAKILLVDAGPGVLNGFGEKQSNKVIKHLENLGIDVVLDTMVTHLDEETVELKHKDGTETTVNSMCKVWAAGVAASPLARMLGEKTGAPVDRAGRITPHDDLTLPGHPEIYVVGDMVALNGLPGVAQVAMQGGKHAAKDIKRRVYGDHSAGAFKYFDKGNMASVSRFAAVCNVGRFQLYGFIAWCMWLVIHIFYLVGFHNRISTLGHWTVAFIGRSRSERTITPYQAQLPDILESPSSPASLRSASAPPDK